MEKTYINVAMGLKREEVRKLLENNEMPRYRFVRMNNPIEMTLEVEDDGTHDPIRYTEAKIRSIPNGKVLFFRVMYYGTNFAWEKKPSTEEQEAKLQAAKNSD